MEKYINEQNISYLEKIHHIHVRQYGFRNATQLDDLCYTILEFFNRAILK